MRYSLAPAVAVAVFVALLEAPLLAQGVSPWLNAVDVLQQAFTGPLARGLSLIAIVIGGLMFAFGEGGSKKALAGIIFGLGMAMGAANFLTWLVFMTIGRGARPWAAYPALSAPLTLMGVERRWFLLSATIGMAMWNAINSILIGAATFCLLYGVGWWAWRVDPHMLTILRESVRFKTRYDPAKWAEQPWYLVITPARRRTRS